MGGLYPGGSNRRPDAHEAAGLVQASRIQPLDALGQVDAANGHIGFVSIGMSNTNQEFEVFEVRGERRRGPQSPGDHDQRRAGRTSAFQWADPYSVVWTRPGFRRGGKGADELPGAGRVDQADRAGSRRRRLGLVSAVSRHSRSVPHQAQEVVRNLTDRYPNIKIAYLSSRTFGGYVATQYPEPVAYEEGFGVKWLIEDQMNGDPALAFGGASAEAPFLSWGP